QCPARYLDAGPFGLSVEKPGPVDEFDQPEGGVDGFRDHEVVRDFDQEAPHVNERIDAYRQIWIRDPDPARVVQLDAHGLLLDDQVKAANRFDHALEGRPLDPEASVAPRFLVAVRADVPVQEPVRAGGTGR